MKTYKGIVTLTLLLLVSSLLMTVMFFQQEVLHFYSAMKWQRQHYVKNDVELLLLTKLQKEQECRQLPLDNDSSVHRVEFKNSQKNDRTSHFVWCERVSLFQKIPTRNISAGEFSQYFDPEITPLFTSLLQQRNRGAYPLYWFSEQETHWEINENLYAVIVAEGNLTLSGKGEIRGAVITKGRLDQGGVNLVYNKKTVQNVMQTYRFWRLAERSWYDFEPL